MKNFLSKLIVSLLLSFIITFIIGICYKFDNDTLNLTTKIKNNMQSIDIINGIYVTRSNDSWFKITGIENSNNYNYIKINVDNLNKNTILSVYYSLGDNLSEDKRIDYNIKEGNNIITLHKGQQFDTLRFDIGNEENIEFKINSLKIVNDLYKINFILCAFILITILLFISISFIIK